MTPEETTETCPECNREMWTAVPPATSENAKETMFCPHCQRKGMAAQGRKDSQTHELAEELLCRGDYGVVVMWQEFALTIPGQAGKKHGCFRFAKGGVVHILGLLARSTTFYANASLAGDHPVPGIPVDEDDDQDDADD